jgi:hypothetical protein
MVHCKTTYELCFGEAYFEYFESCDFSHENTNIKTYRCIRVYVWFKNDKHHMSSECEYQPAQQNMKGDSFASLTCQQTSYSGSAGWYFQYQSIHIQITYTY